MKAVVTLVTLLGVMVSTAMALSIQGSATYRERMALPSAAVFEAVLEDVSRSDKAAETVARTRIASPGNPPIAFSIEYDPGRILVDHRYVVRARILLDERVLFMTDAPPPVITRGSPTRVEILLRKVGSGRPRSRLEGTSWQLVQFEGGDDTVLRPDDRGKYTIEFGRGGRLHTRIDCNRGEGTWSSSGSNQLQLAPLALTRAACPAGSLHDQIVRQWPNIRSYVIKDGHLFLALIADGGMYEFEPLGSGNTAKPRP